MGRKRGRGPQIISIFHSPDTCWSRNNSLNGNYLLIAHCKSANEQWYAGFVRTALGSQLDVSTAILHNNLLIIFNVVSLHLVRQPYRIYSCIHTSPYYIYFNLLQLNEEFWTGEDLLLPSGFEYVQTGVPEEFYVLAHFSKPNVFIFCEMYLKFSE